MSIEQWNSLDKDTKEKVISEVFWSTYIAVTHADKNPKMDTIIQEALRVTTIVGEYIHIDVHKEIKI